MKCIGSAAGFPFRFSRQSDTDSFAWRKNFIQTFLERDIPQFGIAYPGADFVSLLDHARPLPRPGLECGGTARSLGLNESTIRRYLDLLEGVFMVRQLPPWHENLKKRQVKSPKIYFRDSGLLHQLLGIRGQEDLLTHPKCGASWEGYVIEELLTAAPAGRSLFLGYPCRGGDRSSALQRWTTYRRGDKAG